MSHDLSRREMLQTLALGAGAMAAKRLRAATAAISVTPSLARCTVLSYRGEPLSAEDFARFHVCDQMMRPFTIEPTFAPGEAAFRPPTRPFRIALPMVVPGFGHVFVYADNRGRGYTADSFSDRPLQLNHEFAADRLATVDRLMEECRRAGLVISAAARARTDGARALLGKAANLAPDRPAYVETLMSSLCESLWAGEMIVIERAEQMIPRQGPRPGFLFGCNAFGYPRHGEPYAERFEAVFNFATLPFYRGYVERVQGQPDYSQPERILEWLDRTTIIPKGHPLIFLVPNSTPGWLQNLSFAETKKICLRNITEAVLKFRHRIHVWDVINEAHVQPDNYPAPGRPFMRGFTKEENVDLTVAALRAARAADPTCARVVNSTGTWCDYYMGRAPQPWQQSVYDYLEMMKDAGAEYEAIGLQYYHSGRDLLEFERNLESFKGFGHPIHITELGIASSSAAAPDDEWWGGGVGGARMAWRGERFTEEIQSQWADGIYKIAFSKPYVEAITWWDFMDPGFMPNGGYLRADLTPKPAYERLLALQTQWREAGILPARGSLPR